MTTEPMTNGIMLEELHYEPIPEEPTDQIEHPHNDLPAVDETPAPEPMPNETPKITQIEAMRQALADLGLGATNADLADYLRTKFDIQPTNISVLKSQAKRSLFKKQEEETKAPSSTKVPETDPAKAQEAQAPTGERKRKKKADPESEQSVNRASNGHRTVLIRHNKQPDRAVVHRHLPVATTFSIEEVQAVKKLCDRIGGEHLLKLLDILFL